MTKSKVEWTTDAGGQLRLGGIHDGNLVELLFKEGFLSFRVQGVDGGILLFELKGLTNLKLGLLGGAILNDLWIWNVNAVPESLLKYGDAGWNFLLSDQGSPSTRINEQAQKIIKRNHAALFLQIECSYGENIAAICDSIDIYHDGLSEDIPPTIPRSPA